MCESPFNLKTTGRNKPKILLYWAKSNKHFQNTMFKAQVKVHAVKKKKIGKKRVTKTNGFEIFGHSKNN